MRRGFECGGRATGGGRPATAGEDGNGLPVPLALKATKQSKQGERNDRWDQEYAPNKPKRKHLCHELRLHLARLWNRRIESNDATLMFRSFAEREELDVETWRREYYRSGVIRPVFNRYRPHRSLYGRYDPETAQEEATLAASQRGARQRLAKQIADEFQKRILEPGRYRSPYDELQCLR